MQTSAEDSYLSAVECRNCALHYSVQWEDLGDPLACPYCGAGDLSAARESHDQSSALVA